MALLSFLLSAAEAIPLPNNATVHPQQEAPLQAQTVVETVVETVGQPVPPASHTGTILDAVQNNSDSFSNYFESLAILFFILAVLWGIVWLLRKRGGVFPNNNPVMFIENRLSLGPKKWLIVVKAYEKRLLIGVTDQEMSLIADISEKDTPPIGKVIEKPFTQPKETLIAKDVEDGSAHKEDTEKSFAALFEKNVGKNSTPKFR